MMRFSSDFHEQDQFVKILNVIFLVLAPKKGRWGIISLVGSLYI